MSFYPALIQILADIHNHFQLDELGYLAVTSKIENPLRDRVAFALHQKFGQEFLVHREWKDLNNKKADIAITDLNNKVQCLIECKAHSAPTYEKGYSRLTKKDLSKMFHSSEKNTELYFLFFFNHVHSPTAIDPKFRFSIKYWQLLNNALALFKYQPDLTDKVQTHYTVI